MSLSILAKTPSYYVLSCTRRVATAAIPELYDEPRYRTESSKTLIQLASTHTVGSREKQQEREREKVTTIHGHETWAYGLNYTQYKDRTTTAEKETQQHKETKG